MITEETLLNLGFEPLAAFGKWYEKECGNSVSVKIAFTPNGVLKEIHVLNEFSEPYYKDEEICIELEVDDLNTVLKFASIIKRVKVDSRTV